jgi:hypothetical protein
MNTIGDAPAITGWVMKGGIGDIGKLIRMARYIRQRPFK